MTLTDFKALSRGYSNDMSSDAIMKRLEIVNELYQLQKLLVSAKSLGIVEDLKQEEVHHPANFPGSNSGNKSDPSQPSADQPRAKL
jgi:hypothetical protein